MIKKILAVLSLSLLCGLVWADRPPLNSDFALQGVNAAGTNGPWRVWGVINDTSPAGYGVGDVSTGNVIYIYAKDYGDWDKYRITNIAYAVGNSLTCDVVYAMSGYPRSGGPEVGNQIICGLTTNGVPVIPARTWSQAPEALRAGARNDAADRSGGGGGGGTNINITSPDGSVDVLDGSGPVPALSITGYVAQVIAGYTPTNDLRLSDPRDPKTHNQGWPTITDTPTTVSGYGITDAYTKSESDGKFAPTGAVVMLQDATNSLNTRLGTAETDIGNLRTATNTLNANKLNVSGGTMTGSLINTADIQANGYLISANNFGVLGYLTNGSLTTLMRINTANDLESWSTRDFVFISNSTEKMRIMQGGNVGIGTNNPSEKLEVVGNIKVSGTNTAGCFTGNGIGLTNIPGQLSVAEKALATNSIQIGGTASVASIQITGGISTNGAQLRATNSLGQTGWVVPPLTKLYSFTTQTTNTTTLTVTNIGFRPTGASVDALINITGTTLPRSHGFIDGAGVMVSTAWETDNGWFRRLTGECASIYPSGNNAYRWRLVWSSWTDDGAVFTQVKDAGITTNTVSVDILFYP